MEMMTGDLMLAKHELCCWTTVPPITSATSSELILPWAEHFPCWLVFPIHSVSSSACVNKQIFTDDPHKTPGLPPLLFFTVVWPKHPTTKERAGKNKGGNEIWKSCYKRDEHFFYSIFFYGGKNPFLAIIQVASGLNLLEWIFLYSL